MLYLFLEELLGSELRVFSGVCIGVGVGVHVCVCWCVCVADGRHRSVSGSGPGGVLEDASGGNHSGRLQQSQVPTKTFAHLTPELTAITDFESGPAETAGLLEIRKQRLDGKPVRSQTNFGPLSGVCVHPKRSAPPGTLGGRNFGFKCKPGRAPAGCWDRFQSRL